MSKKGFISILGLVGHTTKVPYVDNGEIKNKFVDKEQKDKAKYYFDSGLKEKFGELKNNEYFNMLPLVLENFENYEHACIYTSLSLKIQKSLLEYEKIKFDIEKNGLYISENTDDKESEYSYFLNGINTLIERYDSVIIDMTHGFRHFPILAIINLIIQNIKNPKKVEYILFAKEIKQYKEYKIIDLKEYLDLANLSFMLSNFNQNYTVSLNIRFKNPLYRDIAKELKEFSDHFLSNSLKQLIEGDLITTIIGNLEKLQDDDTIKNFNNYIEEIIEHLDKIRKLEEESEWKKLYKLSQIMDKRGYQLNAITLLFEALGFYCLESLSRLDAIGKRKKEYDKYISEEKKPRNIYSTYTMTNQIRNLVKLQEKFHVNDKKDFFITNEKLKDSVIKYLEHVKIDELKDLIRDIEVLRNNLAHGNSSDSIKDVKKSYQSLESRFKNLCIQTDILNTNQTPSVQTVPKPTQKSSPKEERKSVKIKSGKQPFNSITIVKKADKS